MESNGIDWKALKWNERKEIEVEWNEIRQSNQFKSNELEWNEMQRAEMKGNKLNWNEMNEIMKSIQIGWFLMKWNAEIEWNERKGNQLTERSPFTNSELLETAWKDFRIEN